MRPHLKLGLCLSANPETTRRSFFYQFLSSTPTYLEYSITDRKEKPNTVVDAVLQSGGDGQHSDDLDLSKKHSNIHIHTHYF